MTQYVVCNGRIFDLVDGSLTINHPSYRKDDRDVWSAEALLETLLHASETMVVRPHYFLRVV